ncbi:oxysterol-binding protein-related protein 2 isoform X2 [Pteronotus mesoamericanus]|uniref:oxysterol-binding protein-related protein 2 isoform X2 n=1 Tax=Pteronotus mesoamericanus TaxID=1884717 RepID=UPI0023EDA59C|nr:oxysterol-binding protein-related protein 2 isoform X2 [Pteronotus parnellii mesoamericanus]
MALAKPGRDPLRRMGFKSTGAVQDHNACRLQRAPELPAAAHGVHGAHGPAAQRRLPAPRPGAHAVCGCLRGVGCGFPVGEDRQAIQPAAGRDVRAGQGRPWVQVHIRAGEPPPAHQRVLRRRPEAGLPLPWLHLPEAQVLGEERGGGAPGHHHAGAAQARRGLHLDQPHLLRAQRHHREALDRAVRHGGNPQPQNRGQVCAALQAARAVRPRAAQGGGAHPGQEQEEALRHLWQVDGVPVGRGPRGVRGLQEAGAQGRAPENGTVGRRLRAGRRRRGGHRAGGSGRCAGHSRQQAALEGQQPAPQLCPDVQLHQLHRDPQRAAAGHGADPGAHRLPPAPRHPEHGERRHGPGEPGEGAAGGEAEGGPAGARQGGRGVADEVVSPGQEPTHWGPRLAVRRGLLRAGFLRLPRHLLRAQGGPGHRRLPGRAPPAAPASSGPAGPASPRAVFTENGARPST